MVNELMEKVGSIYGVGDKTLPGPLSFVEWIK